MGLVKQSSALADPDSLVEENPGYASSCVSILALFSRKGRYRMEFLSIRELLSKIRDMQQIFS
jgi:hypothetical protein